MFLIARPGWSNPESEENIPATEESSATEETASTASDSSGTESGSSSSEVEVKKEVDKTKTEKPLWNGFTFNIGLSSNHVLNAEPENVNWVTSYSFRAGWKMGRILFPENKNLKPLSLSASFSMSNEILGNDPRYRSQYFNDTELYGHNLSYLGVNDSILSRSDAENLDRRVSGAQRRMDYSDINLKLSHGSLFTIPTLDIKVSGAMGFVIPTSLTSRNVGLNTKWDTTLNFARSFKVGGKDLSLSYGLTFTYYFYKYKTSYIQPMSEPVVVNGVTYDTMSNESVSRTNEFGFTNMFGVEYEIMKDVSVSMSYGLLTLRTHQFDNCDYTTPTGEVINVCETTNSVRGYDPGSRGRRDFQMFSAGVSYNALDYLSLELSLSSFTPQRKPNSEDYQQPFLSFDRNNYSSVMFNISYSVDAFYKKVVK